MSLNKLGDTSARALAEYLPVDEVQVSDLRPGDIVREDGPLLLVTIQKSTYDALWDPEDPLGDGSRQALYDYSDPMGNVVRLVPGNRRVSIVARYVLCGTGQERVRHAMREAWMPWQKEPLDDGARGFLDGLAYLMTKGCAIKAAPDVLLAWPPYDDAAVSAATPPRWATPEDVAWLATCGWTWGRDAAGWCFSSFYPGG